MIQFKLVRTSFFVALPLLSCQAMALPAVQEPQLQPLMAAVAAEYQQYVANPVALAAPKESQPWPCTVSQAELDVFATTVDSDNDPVMKTELLNYARSHGTPPSKHTYTNKVVTPVRAKCEGGKLSGPVEFWIEYDLAMSNTQFTMKSRNLVRVRANARDGKPDGMVLLAGANLSQQTDYADPATAAMMANAPKPKITTVFFQAVKPAGQVPKATVSTSRIVVDGTLSVHTFTRFSRQDGQVVEDTYGASGPPEHHSYRMLRRNGKLHGPQQTFAGKMGPYPIAASTVCWQEGEKVLTNTCPSD